MFWEERERRSIPRSVKQQVFKRAKGKCENPKCGRQLKWERKGSGNIRGVFHHTRDPTVTPRAKTVQFLCPNCHSQAHEYKTITKTDLFWESKERRIVRKKLGEAKKPAKKQKSKYAGLSKEELLWELTTRNLRQLAKENRISLVIEGLFGNEYATTKEEIIDILQRSRITKKKILAKLS